MHGTSTNAQEKMNWSERVQVNVIEPDFIFKEILPFERCFDVGCCWEGIEGCGGGTRGSWTTPPKLIWWFTLSWGSFWSSCIWKTFCMSSFIFKCIRKDFCKTALIFSLGELNTNFCELEKTVLSLLLKLFDSFKMKTPMVCNAMNKILLVGFFS